ncbi:MAG: TonB-dependent receptor [Saprospiraceae bacterium]
MIVFRQKVLFILFWLLLISDNICGQSTDSLLYFTADEMVFKYATNKPWSTYNDTFTVSENFVSSIDLLFNILPGVTALNGENSAQDVRLSMRGFGARSTFGIRGIKLYLDGIPLTTADGTTQVDEMSTYLFHDAEIVKSNMSARLGNASGGALSFKSPPYLQGHQLYTRMHTLGAYDIGFRIGHSNQKAGNQFNLSHQFFTSKRALSSSQNTVIYNKSFYYPNEVWLLETIVHGYYSPLGQDPGSLTLNEFNINPYQANQRNILYNAGEEVKGFNIAIKSTYDFKKNRKLNSSIFYKARDFLGRLPIQSGGIIDLLRHVSSFQNTFDQILSDRQSFSIGQGFEWQKDGRKRFNNLNGDVGNFELDQKESVRNTYLFQQYRFTSKKISLHQLLRFDHYNFSLKDQFFLDGTQDGRINFSNLQGGLGVNFPIGENWSSFINVGTAFETPTMNEFTNIPGGYVGLNKNLKPERSFQVEWGNYLEINHNILLSSTLYGINIRDLITAYEVDNIPGQTFYRNASQTKRFGLEMMAKIRFTKHLLVTIQYDYSYFKYKNFFINSVDYSNNFQTLTPKNRLVAQAHYSWKNYFESEIFVSYQSPMYLNDLNTIQSPSMSSIQWSISSGNLLSKSFTFGLYFNNLFNLAKYSNFRVNAAQNRFYEAASPPGASLFVVYRCNKKHHSKQKD